MRGGQDLIKTLLALLGMSVEGGFLLPFKKDHIPEILLRFVAGCKMDTILSVFQKPSRPIVSLTNA